MLGFETCPEIDSGGPHVGEGAIERPVPEGAVVGLPVGLEAQIVEPERVALVEQLAEGRLEVARGEALEAWPRKQALGVLGQVAASGQDRAERSTPSGRSEMRGGRTSTDQVPIPISRARPSKLGRRHGGRALHRGSPNRPAYGGPTMALGADIPAADCSWAWRSAGRGPGDRDAGSGVRCDVSVPDL